MSVQVKFNDRQRHGADLNAGRYEDGEGREYLYVVHESGALAIFEKEPDSKLDAESAPIAVYSPSAWFSVTGDPRLKAHTVGGRITAL